MAGNALVLVVCAALTVGAVRLLVLRGIGLVSARLGLSAKARGQVIGYATSLPELVVLVSSALAGVFEAGFWNIASSNMINCALFFLAVLAYRQHRDLTAAKFVDEIVFVCLSVGMPLALFLKKVELTLGLSGALLGVFVLYKVIDGMLSRGGRPPVVHAEGRGNALKGLALLVAGTAVVLVCGRFLGGSAQALVVGIGVPPWLIGWVLGFITSIPEMTSFFEIYRIQKHGGELHLLGDTQEALDALVASNMCNLGLMLPIGMVVHRLAA